MSMGKEVEEGIQSIVVGGRRFLPEVRRLKDMVEVVCDKQFLEHADLNTALYFMFRDVFASEEDLRKIKERGLRYDITVMPPNTLGKEFVKTVGHYHRPCPRTQTSLTLKYTRFLRGRLTSYCKSGKL